MYKKIVLLFGVFVFALVAEEKKLFVIIPSYNNALWAEKNLLSVLNQKYPNFEGIYVDDCSSDKTSTIIQKTLKQFDSTEKIEYVKNNKHRGKAANLWLTLHGFNAQKKIQDDDIVVILDGDDWYPHDLVFSYLNQLYNTHDIWLTYGGFFRCPPQSDKPLVTIPKHAIQHNLFRSFRGCSAQQRTFYAWLYRHIKLSDLFFNGKFVPRAGDTAKIIPMMEMAGPRFKRIDEKIYAYNRANAINDDKLDNLQNVIDHYIREKLCKYQPLRERDPREMSDQKIDIICLANTEQMDQQKLFLEELEKNLKNAGKIHTLTSTQGNTFKKHFLDECALSSDYVCVIKNLSDSNIPQLDLMLVKRVLWATQATTCYLKINTCPTVFEKLAYGINAVQHSCTRNFVPKHNLMDFQIFETAALIRMLSKTNFVNIHALIEKFSELPEFNNPLSVSLFVS